LNIAKEYPGKRLFFGTWNGIIEPQITPLRDCGVWSADCGIEKRGYNLRLVQIRV
jgi:hypothetical protein